ncbi:hypothetical protein CVD28_01315 [Bacillus sp. M6-12]|uniref:hypothetical protein n=1 Tax=Bacillus sp. M6-12 TaxID=2054166 RepID=UPI000C76A510|nr:hypothetical protein [Bacillus sp. M6-12]PLS19073.1 hypothetical protein CVD28_01315 [Bacillus sp. M6-12]
MELTLRGMMKKSRFYLFLTVLCVLPLIFHHGGYIVKNVLSAVILSIVFLTLLSRYNKTLNKFFRKIYHNTLFTDVKTSVYISKAMFIIAKISAILHSGEILLIFIILTVTSIVFRVLSKLLSPFRFRATFVFVAGLTIIGLIPGDIVQMFHTLYDKEYKDHKGQKKEKKLEAK